MDFNENSYHTSYFYFDSSERAQDAGIVAKRLHRAYSVQRSAMSRPCLFFVILRVPEGVLPDSRNPQPTAAPETTPVQSTQNLNWRNLPAWLASTPSAPSATTRTASR